MRYYFIVLCFFVVSTFAKNLPLHNEVKIDSDVNWRIIGGENAAEGQYPHMVSLRGIDNNYHKCGGAIVHEEWVITAAHCLGSDPRYHIVVAGTNKLSEGGDVYKLLEIHSHDLFDVNETKLYDVAIIKVEKIKFNDKVKKIKLEKTFVGEDVPVTLSGWGVTISENGDFSDDLQHATYKTTSVEECRKRVTDFPIEDTQICTLHEADVGACVGDSGSPLIRSVDGTRYAVGIVSWGPYCGSGYTPDIFTRVSSFVSWFNEKCNCNL